MAEHVGIVLYTRDAFLKHIASLNIPKDIIVRIDTARANKQSVKIPLKVKIRDKQVDIDLEYRANGDIYIVRYYNIYG